MKKILFILIGFPFMLQAQTQKNNTQDFSNELRVEIKGGSISLRLQGKEIKHESLVSDLNSLLKLNQDHSFKDVSIKTDDLGYTHFNYKQYYKGIEIDGGLLMVHAKNGLVTSINGKVAEFDNLDLQAAISENEARQFAKTALKVKSLTKELPIEKLIYWNKGEAKAEPFLVYKVRIESLSPLLMYNVFVDAKTGEIIKKISLIAHADVPGTANTYYNGAQPITCDSYSGGYRLRDNARGIHTFDATYADTAGAMNNYDIFLNSADDITSSSTNFDDIIVAGYTDGVEGDVHWGMQQSYDFYLNTFNRVSYDNAGGLIRQYINPPFMHEGENPGPNNAGAIGEGYNFMVFGIGDYEIIDYVASLDVLGHEFTHLVVDNNGNGGLTYFGESGALNESFADIMGISIEHYSGIPNWLIGEQIMLQQPFMRSMSDPNLAGHPDYYEGDYWASTSDDSDEGDAGGVHTNSGVQNYWFYLLSEGGNGTNENWDDYSVNGIGIADAQQIAYRNLTTYLNPDATYQDAFYGSIDAAIDLFGFNSAQYSTVIDAWNAVGLYESIMGCTDPLACNYNVNATVNNASCYFEIYASITQDGSVLSANTSPSGLSADWYNIQGEGTIDEKIWLMQEGAISFSPKFDCTYGIIVEDNYGCLVASETYYYGAEAKRIGSLVASPNPAIDKINVKFENPNNQYVYLHLINNNGVKMDNFLTKDTEIDIDVSSYSSGTYYLYFDSSDSKQGCSPQDEEMVLTKIILNK